ncbi:helix-hairpin-helix domain-containing protein [Mordavella massiliensis]|uniref:Helix-hairpin-helix domain-containing protein n=2 Tax=Mordavella massiliensis TaxID=1871024 RepID=A0A938XCP1_9CLOT|nr:helix-hairpin-helix domain-containing protein [Mordavella massiliensis]
MPAVSGHKEGCPRPQDGCQEVFMLRGPKKVVFLFVIVAVILAGCRREAQTSGLQEVSLEKEAPESGGQQEEEEAGALREGTVFVYVCGQVASPGVYELTEGARVYEALEAAGGALDGGYPESLNLAQEVQDGQKLYVPTQEEALAGGIPQEGGPGGGAQAKVNLNTAGLEELMTLTGIGQTRAEAILAYREEQGQFRAPEDIMNVDGIKEGIYEKLKDEITV